MDQRHPEALKIVLAYQVKFRSSFWKTRSKNCKSSRPNNLRSILNTRNVALRESKDVHVLGNVE